MKVWVAVAHCAAVDMTAVGIGLTPAAAEAKRLMNLRDMWEAGEPDECTEDAFKDWVEARWCGWSNVDLPPATEEEVHTELKR